jgi:hypothetical protein
MAATDKLIPNAITVANNLKGIKYSTSGTYRQPAKKTSKYKNPLIDAINYVASIYAKEVKVANFNETWNYTLVDGSPQLDVFTPDQNLHHMNLGMVLAISENEWNELQIAISKVINIIYPLSTSYYVPYTLAEYNSYLALMGIFNGGVTATKALLDVNGNLLGTFPQGITFADRWNTLKVPADAALGVDTPYIAPVYQPSGETIFFYRYTGKRKWATPFEGYDLY